MDKFRAIKKGGRKYGFSFLVGYGLGPESQHRHSKERTLASASGAAPGFDSRACFHPETGKIENMEEMKMGKTNIDMWYGDKPEQVTGLDIYFNDLGGFYSGNLRIFGKIVGDYYADSVQDIEKAFPHLAEDIENCLN